MLDACVWTPPARFAADAPPTHTIWTGAWLSSRSATATAAGRSSGVTTTSPLLGPRGCAPPPPSCSPARWHRRRERPCLSCGSRWPTPGRRGRAGCPRAARPDRWTSGPAADRVERGRESAMDRVAGRMLSREVDLAARPPLAECLEGGEQPRVDHLLERSERKTSIKALLDSRSVHLRSRGQEPLHVVTALGWRRPSEPHDRPPRPGQRGLSRCEPRRQPLPATSRRPRAGAWSRPPPGPPRRRRATPTRSGAVRRRRSASPRRAETPRIHR